MQLKLVDKLPPAEADMLNRSARTIVEQVGALTLMVDEFSEYARLPAARLAPVYLNGLVTGVLGLYASLEGGDTLRTRLEPELPAILADASQVRRILVNLLKNALEATERQPGGHVELATESVLRGGAVAGVRLTVSDSGPGFAPHMLTRVFEPYVTTKPKGTGLGLAIVRKIADEHGARIEVANRTDPDGQVLGASVSLLFTKLVKNDDNCSFRTTLEPETGSKGSHEPRSQG
jgi:nitrogen fixation/metabolism regulation signal transduction histidine kinase